MFGHDHLEFLRKHVEHRQPERQPIGAVQEQQRRTGAAPHDPHVDVADLVFADGFRHRLTLPPPDETIYNLAETAIQGDRQWPPPISNGSGFATLSNAWCSSANARCTTGPST